MDKSIINVFNSYETYIITILPQKKMIFLKSKIIESLPQHLNLGAGDDSRSDALGKDQSLIPSTRVKRLITTCNSSSKRVNALF